MSVKKGDKVKVHYHGKLTTGETFDSSEGREPLEFEVGAGMMIPGFDAGVLGMAVGEKKTIEIPAAEAYGEADPRMVMEFPKENFPPDITPTVGMQLAMNDGQGNQLPVTIVDVKDETVVLDGNHTLAGKDLIFDVEMVEIEPKSLIIMP